MTLSGILTANQYDVMRADGTEAPGSCALLQEKRPGRFSCVGCGQPLFESRLKFESGTGWRSFNDPIEGAVEISAYPSHGMVRTEVHCGCRFSAAPQSCYLPVTRQMTSPTSSAISTEPSGPIVTPTGRP